MKSDQHSIQLAEMFPLLREWIIPRMDNSKEELARENRSFSRRSRFLSRLSHQSPAAGRYLNGSLHDSTVLRWKSTSTHAHLTVDEFSTHCLFDVLATRLGLTKRACFRKPAPLEIIFETLKQVRVYRISRNRNQPVTVRRAVKPGWEWYDSDIAYLRQDAVSLGIAFCSKGGARYLIVVEAANIQFVERQRTAFVCHFGAGNLAIFKRYWKARSHRPFDCSNVGEFIEIAT
jgi:hypothetical protein